MISTTTSLRGTGFYYRSVSARMKTSIIGRGSQFDKQTLQFVSKRVNFALDRFASTIRSLRIVLSDLNGPRGGLDKSCKLIAELNQGSVLAIEQIAPHTESAVCNAFDRLKQQIGRHLNRLRRKTRRRRNCGAGYMEKSR